MDFVGSLAFVGFFRCQIADDQFTPVRDTEPLKTAMVEPRISTGLPRAVVSGEGQLHNAQNAGDGFPCQ